jgi:hypothetical protein
MSAPRHVAVFGLSANPPTHACGHGGLVRVVAPLVDEVRRAACGMSLLPAHARAGCQLWVLPVFQHVVRVLDTERRVCEAEAQARRARAAGLLTRKQADDATLLRGAEGCRLRRRRRAGARGQRGRGRRAVRRASGRALELGNGCAAVFLCNVRLAC